MHGVRSLRLTGLVVAGLLAATACSGGSESVSDAGRASTTGGAATAAATAATPLKVVSVAPATLTGTSRIVVTFRHPLADDSVLPAISPTRGEISSFAAASNITEKFSLDINLP